MTKGQKRPELLNGPPKNLSYTHTHTHTPPTHTHTQNHEYKKQNKQAQNKVMPKTTKVNHNY